MKRLLILAMLCALAVLVTGCKEQERNGPVACTADAKLCPDGSAVGRVPPDCDFAPCPNPDASGSTFKEFKSQDANQCASMRFTCEEDEFFSDETGCGCIRKHNDAAVTLCSTDYTPVCGWYGENVQCIAYPCASTKGNVCMASIDPNVAYTTPGECPATGSRPTETKLGATDCPSDRPEVCTREYRPVCGQLDTTRKQTFGNSCEACANQDVISYTEGACVSSLG